MKKWKVVYWSNLNRTEWIIMANNKEEARNTFKKLKGNMDIIQICETSENEHN